MRQILRGALGVAVVYPLLWYYSAPERSRGLPVASSLPALAGQNPAAAAGQPEAREARELPGAAALQPRADSSRRLQGAQSVTERLPAPEAPRFQSVQRPQPPTQPTVQDPQSPLAALPDAPELRETLAKAAEIQQHAYDPAALERQVQSLDASPEKLARLKALADLFVQLPTPRGDNYLPASGQSSSSSRAR